MPKSPPKSRPTMRASVLPVCRFGPERRGRSHSGILIIPRQRYSTGEIIRRILRLTSSGFDLSSGIYYLSNF
jgi:hypothetical protein